MKYPDRGHRVSEDKDRFNKMEVILADRFIDNNSNLDPTFCYGVGGTRGAAQRLARDFFPLPAGGNIHLYI
jgi:hypothetical protein